MFAGGPSTFFFPSKNQKSTPVLQVPPQTAWALGGAWGWALSSHLAGRRSQVDWEELPGLYSLLDMLSSLLFLLSVLFLICFLPSHFLHLGPGLLVLSLAPYFLAASSCRHILLPLLAWLPYFSFTVLTEGTKGGVEDGNWKIIFVEN